MLKTHNLAFIIFVYKQLVDYLRKDVIRFGLRNARWAGSRMPPAAELCQHQTHIDIAAGVKNTVTQINNHHVFILIFVANS